MGSWRRLLSNLAWRGETQKFSLVQQCRPLFVRTTAFSPAATQKLVLGRNSSFSLLSGIHQDKALLFSFFATANDFSVLSKSWMVRCGESRGRKSKRMFAVRGRRRRRKMTEEVWAKASATQETWRALLLPPSLTRFKTQCTSVVQRKDGYGKNRKRGSRLDKKYRWENLRRGLKSWFWIFEHSIFVNFGGIWATVFSAFTAHITWFPLPRKLEAEISKNEVPLPLFLFPCPPTRDHFESDYPAPKVFG